MVTIVGCGAGGLQGNGEAPTAPAIIRQPANASVPMGLSAQFTVVTSGYPLNYQWFKNGIILPSATSATYVTPATVFADTASMFTVTISNSLGSVTTTPADLIVTARAPDSGDLRFQEVDAASTVNGYDDGVVGEGSAIPGRGSAYFNLSIGTPLYFGPTICAQPQVNALCQWPYVQFNLDPNTVGAGLSMGYAGDFMSNFQTDLQSATFGVAGSSVDASNSVITSLDLEPADGLFALSYIQCSTSSGFQLNQLSAKPSSLQTMVSSEASQGRVVTGISDNQNEVMLMSYGWQRDTTTVYEAQVVSATSATVVSMASGLALQGYIITALGGSNINDSYFVVGTRVKGDTMPRPFLTTQTNIYYALTQYGYAIVGLIQNGQGQTTYIGER